MGLVFLVMAAAFGWLGAWIGASILYRRKSGRPLFPRVPDNAVFAEAWCSGRSLKNMLSRIGGVSNCLLVYVADSALKIIPVFPFNLMFLPEIYGLENTIPISDIRVTALDGLLGKRLLLTIAGREEQDFELRLRDQQGLQDALEGKSVAVTRPALTKRSDRARVGWRLNSFRVFAVIWGIGAAAAGFSGLAQDIRFRSHGLTATGRIVGPDGEIGARNGVGVVQYVVGGRAYTLTSIRGSGIYKIGDLKKVHYLPDHPGTAREDDYLGFDLLFACLGTGMLALASTIGQIARAFRRSMNI